MRQLEEQTNVIKTEGLGHGRENKNQPRKENERKAENNARERSKTESEMDLKVGKSLQKAESMAVYKEREREVSKEIICKGQGENAGKENKEVKDQNFDKIRQNEAQTERRQGLTKHYEKVWK